MTGAVTLISNQMPVNIMPNLALCPVIGLLFGPFASLGVNLVSLIDNLRTGTPIPYCIMDLVTVFLVSYIPHKLWYSTFMTRDNRPPVLDSVRNIAKFILMMTIASMVYTVLYIMTYGLMESTFTMNHEDIVRFLNVMSFSFLFGLSAIPLLRYLGVRFYTPKFGGTPDDFRRRVNPYVYYASLAMALISPVVILKFYPEGPMIPIVCLVSYALIIAFLLKPVEQASTEENTTTVMGIGFNKFNRTLIERMIVIFIVYGLMICIVAGAAASMGMLEDVFGWGHDVALLSYMSLGLMIFLLSAVVFLWYIEKNITVPIGELSEASRDFINGDHEFSSTEFAYSCRDLVDLDSEIGDLSRSLIKMTGDIEEYVEDLRTLNNQQEKYRAELNVAKNIQESFVPRNFSSVEGSGVSIAGSMTAARYVGGDFYDFFMIDEDHIGLCIGDVSGKGVPAALFMAVTKSLIEGHSRPGLKPESILAKVNLNLCRNNDEFMYVTAWMGVLELTTGRLWYCSAGHNPPVIVRCNKEPELLTTKQCLILGAREGVSYTSEEIVMERGDRILLYTDGVTEANDHFEGFYGTDRLMKVLGADDGTSLKGQIDAVLKDISEFTNGAEQFDDMTMLMFKYDGAVDGSAEILLDSENIAPAVAPVTDAIDTPLDKEDA